MPYLRFELDALPKIAPCARAAKVAEGVIAWGLVQTWEWCWREKRTDVTEKQLEGFFGADVRSSLVAFGFLKDPSKPGQYPVSGAEKYLRISKGSSAGGKAAAGNLKRGNAPGGQQPNGGEPAGDQPGNGREPAGEQSADLPAPASSEQRAANSEQLTTTTGVSDAVRSVGALAAPVAVLAGAQPDRRARPREEPGTLRDKLEGVFQRVRKQVFRWRTADDNACRELLAAADDDWGEIARRWELGLLRRFPACNNVADLAKNWNAYAAEEPTPPAKGRAPESAKYRADGVPVDEAPF